MDQHYDKDVAQMALQAGYILLENGAEIFRVEETMERICLHFGVTSFNTFVMSNGIFATAFCKTEDGEEIFARVRHLPVGGTNLERVTAVNQLSREIADGKYTVEAAKKELMRIKSMPGKRKWPQILASGVGSGAFSILFGGTLPDGMAAFIAGFILYIFLLEVAGRHLSRIVTNVAGGLLVTLINGFLFQLGLGNDMNYMIIGSIMPLIPGVAFVTGIRDIANGDYLSGWVRLLDALLVFFSIAGGVGVGISILHVLIGGVGL